MDYMTMGRPRAFTGPDAAARAERAGRWVQATLLGDHDAAAWCRDNGMFVTRAMGESIGTAGGFLVPAEVEEAIIALRDIAGVFRQKATVRTMGSDVRHFPRRLGGLTAYFTAENAALTESSATWDNVTLSAKKLGILNRVSSELLEDEVVGLGEYFVQEMAFAFADKEDDCGFVGDGTSTYGGMTGLTKALIGKAGGVAAASAHNTFLTLDGPDVEKMMAALPAYAWQGACFYCSAYALATLFARLTVTTGGVIMTQNGPRQLISYLGFPVIPTPKLPTGTTAQSGNVMILFGDLSLSTILGSRRGVSVARSVDVFFESDTLAIRGTERFDIVNSNVGDSTTAGPIVGLIGTA